jgi:hypothetical protein
MLKNVIAALALSLACAGGAAGRAPVPAAAPTVEQFAQQPDFTGASLSPSGRYVAGIKLLEKAQELVVLDRQTGRWNTVHRSVEDDGFALNWVSWKNDERLLIGAQFRLQHRGAPWVSRVLVSPRTGGAVVTLFGEQTRQLAFRDTPVTLVSRLPRDPDHVLLSTLLSIGPALWKANINTGRAERIELGNLNTRYWALDLDGTPVLRRDDMYRNSGYRMFRRAPGTSEWIQFFEEKRAAAVDADEFTPYSAAPGKGQIYVAARPAGRDLNALYAYDAATGAYGARACAASAWRCRSRGPGAAVAHDAPRAHGGGTRCEACRVQA